MSKVYITEFVTTPRSGAGHTMQIPGEYGIDQTPVDFSGGAAQSAAFGLTTNFVRLNCDAVCSIAFGASPTATTGNRRMSANQTEYFPVVGGHKLSAITNT